MENRRISATDVKKYFLLADTGKEIFAQGDIFSEKELQKLYLLLFGAYNRKREKELDKLITDKIRLNRYNSLDWYMGDIELQEMGPWPKMKGLPIGFTTGNIPETAKKIKKFKEDRIDINHKEAEKTNRCVRKLDSLIRHINFVRPNFPLILLPGGEIREKDYNEWARKNNEPLCKIFEYDLDDGNERAVSYSLDGLETAPCLFAMRKC